MGAEVKDPYRLGRPDRLRLTPNPTQETSGAWTRPEDLSWVNDGSQHTDVTGGCSANKELKENAFLPPALVPESGQGRLASPAHALSTWDTFSGTATAVGPGKGATGVVGPLRVERVGLPMAAKNGHSCTLWSFGDNDMSM